MAVIGRISLADSARHRARIAGSARCHGVWKSPIPAIPLPANQTASIGSRERRSSWPNFWVTRKAP